MRPRLRIHLPPVLSVGALRNPIADVGREFQWMKTRWW